MKNILLIPTLLLLLSSCLPKPPGKKIIQDSEIISDFGIEIIKVNNIDNTKVNEDWSNYDGYIYETVIPDRNMVFISLDETVQVQFQDQLKRAYKTRKSIRFEDVAFWQFSKQFVGLYDNIIRVPHDQVHKDAIILALEMAESFEKPYDLFLLVHGIPNHITTTKGFPLLSYSDIQEVGEKTFYLHSVFQQNCFGNTLVEDWMDAGAKYIISFDGWNRNFFYADFYLRNLNKYKGDVSKAYEKTNKNLRWKMNNSIIYHKVFEVMGVDMEDYLKETPKPTLSIQTIESF